jgi:hypothetical protein
LRILSTVPDARSLIVTAVPLPRRQGYGR